MVFNSKQIEILQISETLFAEKGFDGTSIRAISEKANVNVAMISYYFGSKEKLLESLIIFRTTDLKTKLENLLDEQNSPLDKIEKFIQLYIKRVDENREFHQILLFEISSNKRAMDFESFTEIRNTNIKTLEKIINEGQLQNIFRKNINTQLILPTILGTYFYIQMNKSFFITNLNLENESEYQHFIQTDLTNHIQQTIKSLLLYEY
jgi:AcrR family transcriptional regulator